MYNKCECRENRGGSDSREQDGHQNHLCESRRQTPGIRRSQRDAEVRQEDWSCVWRLTEVSPITKTMWFYTPQGSCPEQHGGGSEGGGARCWDPLSGIQQTRNGWVCCDCASEDYLCMWPLLRYMIKLPCHRQAWGCWPQRAGTVWSMSWMLMMTTVWCRLSTSTPHP